MLLLLLGGMVIFDMVRRSNISFVSSIVKCLRLNVRDGGAI